MNKTKQTTTKAYWVCDSCEFGTTEDSEAKTHQDLKQNKHHMDYIGDPYVPPSM